MEKLGIVRGKWSVSPLREAKTLLGVLKQQGLAGKGLIEAFEKWAPRITGSSRADMNRLYREQTGREMSDYILVQQADKIVRYNQRPLKQKDSGKLFWRSRQSGEPKQDDCRQVVAHRKSAKREPGLPALYRVRVEVRADKGNHDGTILLAALNGREAAERARSGNRGFLRRSGKGREGSWRGGLLPRRVLGHRRPRHGEGLVAAFPAPEYIKR